MPSTLYLDFETECAVSISSVGAYRYTRHKSFGPICLGFQLSGDAQPSLLTKFCRYDPAIVTWQERLLYGYASNPEVIFCAHNAHFDRHAWTMIMVPLGYPEIPLHRWRCTMAKAYAYGMPASLEDCGAALRLGMLKDTEAQAKAKILFSPKPASEWKVPWRPEFWTIQEKPDEYKAMYKYCLGDIATLIGIDLAIPNLIPIEQEIWEMDQRINDRGIYVDLNLVNRVIDLIERQKEVSRLRFIGIQEANFELEDLTYGVLKPTQRELIKGWLKRRGFDLPNMQKGTLLAFLRRNDVPGYIKEVVEIYQSCSKSSLAKFPAMLNYADACGIIRELAQYHGSATGRWAHRGVQFGNMARPEYPMDQLCDDIEKFGFGMFKLMYPEVTRALVSAARGMVTPRE